MGKIKQPQLTQAANIELPNEMLVDLMMDVLARGSRFKFQAKGASMSPFIRDGDTLTIVPLEQLKPAVGRVVACINPQSQKLIVHRIVTADNTSFLIKGDNSAAQYDGWIPREKILGMVTKVERGAQQIKLGLGIERWLIAFLSKQGLLTRIINRLRRIIQ